MLNNNTDKDWEKFGKEDPYFGVLTDDKFRRSNLTEESKKEFFKSGTDYINFILKNIEHHVDTEYTINRALDFGCGVGRLAIPLAYIAQEVTGVDVSESMLKEAKENCKERSIENVTFVYSDDDLSMLNGKYDFIHSFLVFQHIPAERGEQIFEKLMERLESGGIGVMHFTYAKDYEIKGLIPLIKRYIPLASNFINWIKGKGFFYYGMQMNAYDTNNLLLMIQKANVKNFYTEFTHSEDEFGLMIYFKKPEKS